MRHEYLEVIAIVKPHGNHFLAGAQVSKDGEIIKNSTIASPTLFNDLKKAEKKAIQMAKDLYKELNLKTKEEIFS